MKVVLDKAFPLDATADSAWQLMQDIEAVAACMPGAKITERVDDTHYKGTITVRLGPATMAFKGDIEVLALDAAARSLHLLGKGTDASGSSAATMDLTAAVEPSDAACTLKGKSEVTMSGKAAAIGGRLMAPASEQLLKQFVANFAARLDAMQTSQTATADTTQTEAAASGEGADAAAPASATKARAATPPPAQAAELNGFAFIWAMIRDWLHGRFSHKAQGR
jgi:carbon monoxide dehydrogenase subunit G